jgi:hypothetical protein
MERSLMNKHGERTPAMTQGRYGAGVEDLIIVPLALMALAGKNLLLTILSVLTHIVDYTFPILLQLMRIPLVTTRIIGDRLVVALKFIVRYLPVSCASRERWREVVSRGWSWLRQKISYKAFEEAVHHAFESGMAWVFRKCRKLTPRGALLVITGAVAWLPVSLAAATAMHAVLIAQAASLPPWMQLLHLLATLIAKSKLLVLPVYPAAWPQAKRDAFVQAIFQFYHDLTSLHLMQKMAYRYRQTEDTAAGAIAALRRAASLVGLGDLSNTLLTDLNRVVGRIGKASRAAMTRTVEALSRVVLIGVLFRSYAAHYEGARQRHEEKFSEKVRGFFGRWSIKFSAEYYETKERDKAKKH